MMTDASAGKKVFLGRVGENEARVVRFSVGKMLAAFPGATFTVLNRRPCDAAAYPVNDQYVSLAGDTVLWTIQSGDVTVAGTGECEIRAEKDGKILKSQIYMTETGPALDGSGTPPQPWESWVQQVEDAAEDAEAAAQLLENVSAAAETLEAGENATASYSNGTFTFGIPRGADGQGQEIHDTVTDQNVANVKDAAAGNVSGLVLTVLPIQAGSGDPAPDNVRAISGRSSVVLKQGGKNLADMSFVSDAQSGAKYHTITLRPNTTYTMSSNDPTKNNAGIADLFFCEMDEEVNSGNNGVWLNHPKTRTTNGNGQLRIGYRCNESWITPAQLEAYETQIEVGSSASSYEQYREIATHTASIPTPPGTVYGGEIDWVRQKLKVTHAIIDIGTLSWVDTTASGHAVFRANPTGMLNVGSSRNTNGCCSHYKMATDASDLTCFFYEKAFYVRDDSYEGADAFKTAITGENCYLCYPLATPVEYDMTGLDEITLVFGENNVWIDNGQIKSMTYPCDIKLYIDKKVSALQALILEH